MHSMWATRCLNPEKAAVSRGRTFQLSLHVLMRKNDTAGHRWCEGVSYISPLQVFEQIGEACDVMTSHLHNLANDLAQKRYKMKVANDVFLPLYCRLSNMVRDL
jgi:hypothetical protein